MSYSYTTFIRPTSSDVNIKIYDITGDLVYTINPFSVINIQISNNLIKIYLKELDDILIDFDNPTESKVALQMLQSQLTTLRQKNPLFIDDQIKNYVDNIGTIGDFTIHNGPGSGSNPNFAILSNGKVMQITVIVGNNPLPDSNVFIISLENPKNYNIYPIISPGNDSSATSNVYAVCSDGININLNVNGVLIDSTVYTFNILI